MRPENDFSDESNHLKYLQGSCLQSLLPIIHGFAEASKATAYFIELYQKYVYLLARNLQAG